MAAYDPKRPRPAQLSDDPAPVDALLEHTGEVPVVDPVTEPPVSTNGSRPAEVPVAPAPEVGTANRAVLYASLGVGALLTVLLIVLRRRARRAAGTSDT